MCATSKMAFILGCKIGSGSGYQRDWLTSMHKTPGSNIGTTKNDMEIKYNIIHSVNIMNGNMLLSQ